MSETTKIEYSEPVESPKFPPPERGETKVWVQIPVILEYKPFVETLCNIEVEPTWFDFFWDIIKMPVTVVKAIINIYKFYRKVTSMNGLLSWRTSLIGLITAILLALIDWLQSGQLTFKTLVMALGMAIIGWFSKDGAVTGTAKTQK